MPSTSNVNRQSRDPFDVPVQAAANLVSPAERPGHEGRPGEGLQLAGDQEAARLEETAVIEEGTIRDAADQRLELVEPSEEVLARDAQAPVLQRGIDRPELHVRREQLDAGPQCVDPEERRTIREPEDRVFGVRQGVGTEPLVPLARDGEVGADPRGRRLMVLDVRRPGTESLRPAPTRPSPRPSAQIPSRSMPWLNRLSEFASIAT